MTSQKIKLTLVAAGAIISYSLNSSANAETYEQKALSSAKKEFPSMPINRPVKPYIEAGQPFVASRGTEQVIGEMQENSLAHGRDYYSGNDEGKKENNQFNDSFLATLLCKRTRFRC